MKKLHKIDYPISIEDEGYLSLREEGLYPTMCGYGRSKIAASSNEVTCKLCKINMAKKGYELCTNLTIEEKLKQIYLNCSTRQIARVFAEYAESRGFEKLDGRRKKNIQLNTYYCEGESEYWDRVTCQMESACYPDLEMYIVLRKNSYMFIRIMDEEVFSYERMKGVTKYDEEKLNGAFKKHKKLFNMLLAYI